MIFVRNRKFNLIFVLLVILLVSLIFSYGFNKDNIRASAEDLFQVYINISTNQAVFEDYQVYLDVQSGKTSGFSYPLSYGDDVYYGFVPANNYYLYIFEQNELVFESSSTITVDSLEFVTYEFYDLGFGLTSNLPLDYWGQGSADISWYLENPSSSDFHISSGQELAGLAEIVNLGSGSLYYNAEGIVASTGNFITFSSGETFSADNIYLDNDIYIGEHKWKGIGSGFNSFEGNFFGGDNTIYGLYEEGATAPIGLFSTLLGNIEGVILDKGFISGDDYLGGFAGISLGEIYGCTNKFVNIFGSLYVGGIVGNNDTAARIEFSSNHAFLQGTQYIGGINGYNQGEIDECSNYSGFGGGINLGGITGLNTGNGIIINSSNAGSIYGTSNIGGLAGGNTGLAKIFNSYNLGSVVGTSNIGGIAGIISSEVENCFNSGLVTGGEQIGVDSSGSLILHSYYLSNDSTSEGNDELQNAFKQITGFYCVDVFQQYLIDGLVMLEDDTVTLLDALNAWVSWKGLGAIAWKENLEFPTFLEKREVSVQLGDGFIVTPVLGSEYIVREGESFSFTVQLLQGYTDSIFSVYANETLLLRNAGVYTATNIQEDTIIYVLDVTLNIYTISFVAGPTLLSQEDYSYGENPIIPPNPEKESTELYEYTFTGWDQEIVPAVANVTYYAVFEENTRYYTVTFLSEGVVVSSKADYQYGEDLVEPISPTKPSDNTYEYVFSAWDKELTSKVYESREYNALYIQSYIDYSITFLNGETIVSLKLDAHFGDTIISPSAPTRNSDERYSYQFIGWSSPTTIVNGDIVFEAEFISINIDYTIIFLNGEEILSSEIYHFGDEVETPATPIKESDEVYSYSFIGWNKEVELVSESTMYSALFLSQYREYNIVFRSEGNIVFQSTYHYGETVIAPSNPEKEEDNVYEYVFLSWTPDIVEVSSDATYIATFSEQLREYEIVFMKDSYVVSRTSYNYGDTITYPGEMEKTSDNLYAYEFIGWDKNRANVIGDDTINALFTRKPLTIESDLLNSNNLPLTAVNANGFPEGATIVGRVITDSANDFGGFILGGEELYSLYNASVYLGDTLYLGDMGEYTINLDVSNEFEDGITVKVVSEVEGQYVAYYTQVVNGIVSFTMGSNGDFAIIIEGDGQPVVSLSPYITVFSFLGIALILVAEFFIIKAKMKKKAKI